MATSSIDGAPVSQYLGRISGAFDLDDATDFFQMGDVVMAVVVLHAGDLGFRDNAKGDRIGTYRFTVRDFALVSDEVLRKALFYHLPHLEPEPQLPFSSLASAPVPDAYEEIEDTITTTEQIHPEDILLVDPQDEEVFSPVLESRERARLTGSRDPLLQQFLDGGN